MKDIDDLHAAWHHWNQLFFDGELPPATRFTLEKLSARTLGRYWPSTREIVLPVEHLTDYRKGPIPTELAAHVVLHEMCHAWVSEVRGDKHDIHGPVFGEIANRVGARLGVPPCRLEDLWCWPDHPREGAGPYEGVVRSHGEIMHERLWEAARRVAGTRWCPVQLKLFRDRIPELPPEMPKPKPIHVGLFGDALTPRGARRKRRNVSISAIPM